MHCENCWISRKSKHICVDDVVRNDTQKGNAVKDWKDCIWNYNEEIEAENVAAGVCRKVLAFTEELMCVENHFEEGAIGALHHHPHTQITYVVSGQFEFEIDGVKKIVNPGDTMLKKNSVEHGCTCLKKGILLDIFAPMREDFLN